jgi:hypothetical protein
MRSVVGDLAACTAVEAVSQSEVFNMKARSRFPRSAAIVLIAAGCTTMVCGSVQAAPTAFPPATQQPRKQPVAPLSPARKPTVQTAAPSPTPGTVSSDLQVSGSVAQGQFTLYAVPVASGSRVDVRTSSTADIDLYLRQNTPPTTSAYDQRANSSSGNERLIHTAATHGTLHIGVFGHSAGEFVLTVKRVE